MPWTYPQLRAAYQALSPPPASNAAAATAINAQTITVPAQDTDGWSVRGLLYTRGSWERLHVATATGSTVAVAIQATCLALLGMCETSSPVPIATSLAPVWAKCEGDLTSLGATKLADGRGIIWAAGELASGDPGDLAALTATLVTPTVPVWQPPVTANDIAAVM